MFAGRGNYHAMTTKITLQNGGRLDRKKSAFISRAIPLGAATVPRSCGGPVRMVKSCSPPRAPLPKRHCCRTCSFGVLRVHFRECSLPDGTFLHRNFRTSFRKTVNRRSERFFGMNSRLCRGGQTSVYQCIEEAGSCVQSVVSHYENLAVNRSP